MTDILTTERSEMSDTLSVKRSEVSESSFETGSEMSDTLSVKRSEVSDTPTPAKVRDDRYRWAERSEVSDTSPLERSELSESCGVRKTYTQHTVHGYEFCAPRELAGTQTTRKGQSCPIPGCIRFGIRRPKKVRDVRHLLGGAHR